MAVILDEPGYTIPGRVAARTSGEPRVFVMPDSAAALKRFNVMAGAASEPKLKTNGNDPGMGDLFPTTPTKAISGIIYGPGDLPVANAIVQLFRQADNLFVQQSTTDAAGAYVFPRDETDALQYYVIAYKPGAIPQVHGVSDRDLVAL